MGRQAEHTTTVATGERVGYSLTDRPGGYRVRFVGPGGKPGPVPQTYVVNPLWERAGSNKPADVEGDFGDGFASGGGA